MIRKLRVKFILATMFSLFVVLSIILGIVAALSYRQVVTDADSVLEILCENGGAFPDSYFEGNGSTDKSGGTFLFGFRLGSRLTEELPYESRYFVVALSGKGAVLYTNTEQIAAIDAETAIEYAETVWEGGQDQGFVGNYRYLAYTEGAQTRVIFLDCTNSLRSFRIFALIGVLVSLAGLTAVFLLMLFLSGRIVRPFSENYEKQKRFITDAGHELKTPLTIIDADAEILEMDLGENEWLADIQSQTKRLADLTNDLILLSRMEEAENRTQRIEFPLSDVVEEIFASFQAVARTQGKSLESHIQPMLSFCGDEKAIRQLTTILLDNALKYSQEGSRISLTLEKKKNTVRLTVYNTTPSITKEQIEHLFDRFYRADASRNSAVRGHGLGLSIAGAIVAAHKGKISAATEDGQSLQITAALPG
ncbi:MAG: HAMP domain-containing histidine kinase [Lachnospiraceae bacterium]|nr:HAMP domain-containing histidine kinase [Lachnospiraceae bacterium]